MILQDLRLANDEIARLRDRDLKNLLRHKKLYLVLDLDHTLLNSSRMSDIIQEEGYLMNQNDPVQGIYMFLHESNSYCFVYKVMNFLPSIQI